MENAYHVPVLLEETLELLAVEEGKVFVDCTLGGGGHAAAMLERGASVIALDRDREAVSHAGKRLADYGGRFEAHEARFSALAAVAGERRGRIDGVLMDLGVSSHMLDDPSRGFSFKEDGPLTMTMGDAGTPAAEIIAGSTERELARIFREYGEERMAARIAKAIVREREKAPITTTGRLAALVEQSVGGPKPQKSKARVFQALRIHVNEELDELSAGLEAACEVLGLPGRLCVISYHSLEDRMVKRFMRDKADPCTCPPDLPVCSCGRTPELRVLTRKPVKPGEEECRNNPRARSARLRAAEKVQ